MNIIRYLSFEVGRDCNLAEIHKDKCPIAHPERYLFSKSKVEITDDLVVDFWKWCRYEKNFRGIILWHGYLEPTMHIARIRKLMKMIKYYDPFQPFQITTNTMNMLLTDFDIVKRSDYGPGGGLEKLDNRIANARGEGLPYAEMSPKGRCGRGLGWEIPIDIWGNWNLCCVDLRNEEAVGSIVNLDWEEVYQAWKIKSRMIQWNNQAEYEALPRMCRSCMATNDISRMGGI